jgi:hypothetical protein
MVNSFIVKIKHPLIPFNGSKSVGMNVVFLDNKKILKFGKICGVDKKREKWDYNVALVMLQPLTEIPTIVKVHKDNIIAVSYFSDINNMFKYIKPLGN